MTYIFRGKPIYYQYDTITKKAKVHRKLTRTQLEITTDTVANATNVFSLGTKNSGSVATLATRFLYDLDLN